MAHAALGNAYDSTIYNNPVAAKAHLERAVQLSEHTTQREAQVIEIDYESALGHFDKAHSLYEIYLKKYPDDHTLRYNYGGLLRDHGDYSDAVTQYLEVLRIDPGDANANINLATSYSMLGKHSQALESYAKAFSLEPTWITMGNLNHEYGFELVLGDQPDKAEELFLKALTTPSKALATRSLALLDMYRGKYRNALERLQEAILLNQSDRASLSESRNQFFCAQALEALGKPQASLEALDRSAAAWSATTGQAWLGSRIAIAFARGGRLDKATQLMGKIRAQTDVSNSRQASDVHRLEGEAQIARGVTEKGIELLLLADRENHSSLTQESLARAYRVSGNIDRARPAYDAIIAMPNLSLGWEAQQGWLDAHYWRATTDERSASNGEALRIIDRLFVLWKDADPDVSTLNAAKRLRTRFSQNLPSVGSRQP
jgi:tetratricopeptide (TPR) repeat protein